MSTIQSGLPIEKAVSQHNWYFAVYVLFLFLMIVLTYLVWKSGGRVQDAIKADADARIEEAKRGAEKARKQGADALKDAGTANRAAGEANLRAQHVENDNLTLRGQIATLEIQAADAKKDVAGLQKAAANAKAAQQKVETDLARQREHTARAESDLLKLEERIQPRSIRGEKRHAFLEVIGASPKGAVQVWCVGGDLETCLLANDIRGMLSANGWDVGPQLFSIFHLVSENTPIGISLRVKDRKAIPSFGEALIRAIHVTDLPTDTKEDAALSADLIVLSIGVKPLPL